MAFIDEVDSLKTKLHLNSLSFPLRIGIIVICAIVLFVLFQGLWQLGSSGTLSFADPAQSSQKHEEDEYELVISSDGSSSTSIGSDGSEQNEDQISSIAVHVTGAVVAPGLYHLSQESRVGDAVEAAGGMSEDADPGSVNLARKVEDGEQIIVNSKTSQGASTSDVAAPLASASSSGNNGGGLVNINSADINTLCSLPGVGESTAKKIIADRDKNGMFKSKKDITRVSGIGDKKYEAIADLITV